MEQRRVQTAAVALGRGGGKNRRAEGSAVAAVLVLVLVPLGTDTAARAARGKRPTVVLGRGDAAGLASSKGEDLALHAPHRGAKGSAALAPLAARHRAKEGEQQRAAVAWGHGQCGPAAGA